jgi:hypothetical protein
VVVTAQSDIQELGDGGNGDVCSRERFIARVAQNVQTRGVLREVAIERDFVEPGQILQGLGDASLGI